MYNSELYTNQLNYISNHERSTLKNSMVEVVSSQCITTSCMSLSV